MDRSDIGEQMDSETSAIERDFPAKDSIGDLIASLSRLLTANFMKNLAVTGVTPAQTFVLRELMLKEPQTQSDIARCLQVSRASIGETLTRLEKLGLVERQKSPSDGRTLLSSLTPEARRLKADLVRSTFDQFSLVDSILEPEQQVVLQSLLSTLLDGIRDHLGEGVTPGLNG